MTPKPPTLTDIAIVSEIRNALGPVRGLIRREAYRVAETANLDAAARGVDRVLALADELAAWLDAQETP